MKSAHSSNGSEVGDVKLSWSFEPQVILHRVSKKPDTPIMSHNSSKKSNSINYI